MTNLQNQNRKDNSIYFLNIKPMLGKFIADEMRRFPASNEITVDGACKDRQLWVEIA
jgi:hypothetical protein